MMLSQCPKCETVFQISELQLQAKDGLVRCGHCQFVFNAAWNLLDVPPDENGFAHDAPPPPPPNREEPPVGSEPAPRDYAEPPAPADDETPATPPRRRQSAATAKLEAVRAAVARMRGQPPAPAEAAGALDETQEEENPPAASPAAAPPPAVAAPAEPPGEPLEEPLEEPTEAQPEIVPPPPDAMPPSLSLEAADEEPLDEDESPSGGTPTLLVEATPAQQAALSDDGRWGWGIGESEDNAPGAQSDGRRVGPAGPEERRLFFPDHEPDEEIVLASPEGHVHEDVEEEAEALEQKAAASKHGDGLDIPSIAEGRRTPLREYTISLGKLGRRGKSRRWLWIALAVILLLALAGQAAYFFLADAAERPVLRAGLQSVCAVVHCNVPPRRDLARVELLETRVAPHAVRGDALELSATLVNRAPFAQAYPLIEVTLTNPRGEIVARRTFAPEVYLDAPDPRHALMPRNIAVDVVLSMTRPQPQTSGYEVRLAEAQRTRSSVFKHFVADMSLSSPFRDLASGIKSRIDHFTGGAAKRS